MKKIYIVGFLLLLACLTPLLVYFVKFHFGLSAEHSVWGDFGSLYGGVLGPAFALLAFIGLLFNLEVTKRQFRIQSEDNTFFNLIDLHNNKLKMVEFEKSENNVISGFEAFKRFNNEFKNIYDEEAIRISRVELTRHTRRINQNKAIDFFWNKYSRSVFKNEIHHENQEERLNEMASFFESCNDFCAWDAQKSILGNDCDISIDDRDELRSIGHVIIEDFPSKDRINVMMDVSSVMYDKHGYMLGHYFRNIYYILKIIDESLDSEKYSKLFRAQLSRYELAMIYCNSISKKSSKEFIDLLIKYEIFNGIYSLDICYYPDSIKQRSDLDFVKSML